MSTARSDALVLFGATGDLAYRKIFPALHDMIRHGQLDCPIIGVARTGSPRDQMRTRIVSFLEKRGAVDESALDTLMQRFEYVQGDYLDDSTYDALRVTLGDAQHPLYYLAIPPEMFGVVARGLGRSGCARGSRIVVEKPFGRDAATARALNDTLLEIFDESQIFRIDHYLGKESVQNLLMFRFANTFIEPAWNRHHVRRVRITMTEKLGVEGRGAFYEQVGTIRDVIQNHLFEVLTYIAMEVPTSTAAAEITERQVDVLQAIKPLTKDAVVRGQADEYRNEPNVAADSTVETFAALHFSIDNDRWRDVPFSICAGKYLANGATDVHIELGPPPLPGLVSGDANFFHFRLSPTTDISIGAHIKRGGAGLVSEPASLNLVDHTPDDGIDPYERLLGDAMAGDRTLFTSQEFIEAAWRIVDDVVADPPPVLMYAAGSAGPALPLVDT